MINKQYLLIFFMLLAQVGLLAQNGGDSIFNDFPWLSLHIDENNCEGANVQVFLDDKGTHFVYVRTGTTKRLFYGDGAFACITASNIDCLEFCGIGQNDLVDAWLCPGDGGMFTDPPSNNVFEQTPTNLYVDTPFEDLKVYPTIANETIQVYFSNKADIRLIDLSGKVLFVMPHAGGHSTLKVTDLAEGYYMVQVQSERAMKTSKIIVSH
ncbi:MAG: T9SS type A sorting domain-containing protein [Saprospiraceae bacterium]